MTRIWFAVPAVAALALAGCKTTDQAVDGVKSVGSTVANAAGDAAKGAVSLVNVDLSNVLNDLALNLKIDKANIPINAQIPIDVAANVCGVTINILAVSTGGNPNCTAKSTSPALDQAVQQQLAANGSVGGGAQTSGATGTTSGAGTATTSGSTAGTTTSGTTTSGTTTSGTNTTTSGTTTGTTATPTVDRPAPTEPVAQ